MKRRRHRFLLAFYPRAWRRRYGEEFDQLLADLEAEHEGGSLRRAVDVVLQSVPVRLVSRPAATTLVVLLTGGAMATAGVLVQVPATSQEGAITSPWSATRNAIIVRSGHHTYMSEGYSVHDGPKSQQVVRIHARAANGDRVVLYCSAGVCHRHSPRR